MIVEFIHRKDILGTPLVFCKKKSGITVFFTIYPMYLIQGFS